MGEMEEEGEEEVGKDFGAGRHCLLTGMSEWDLELNNDDVV